MTWNYLKAFKNNASIIQDGIPLNKSLPKKALFVSQVISRTKSRMASSPCWISMKQEFYFFYFLLIFYLFILGLVKPEDALNGDASTDISHKIQKWVNIKR